MMKFSIVQCIGKTQVSCGYECCGLDSACDGRIDNIFEYDEVGCKNNL